MTPSATPSATQTPTHAQQGAQPADDAMPIDTPQEDLAVVLQVMHDAGLNQETLARALNINKGHFSRILSGGAPVPFVMVRWLWDRTSDDRLLALLGAGNGAYGIARFRREKIPAGIGIDGAIAAVMSGLSRALHLARHNEHAQAAAALEDLNCILAGAKQTALDAAARIAGDASTTNKVQRQPLDLHA